MKIRKLFKIIEYLHATLIWALPIPVLYAIVGLQEPKGEKALYIKCLLLALSIIVTDVAIRHTKNLILYLVICVLLGVGIWGFIIAIPILFYQRTFLTVEETCYIVGVLLETIVIALLRLQNRLKETARRREDPLAPPSRSFLDTPSFSLLWYFALLYLIGLGFASKMVCDMAWLSAIAYVFLTVLYDYLDTTKRYLSINKRTKGISIRRLYGIRAVMMVRFGILLVLGILPSVLFAGCRRYTDIREWFNDMGPIVYEYESSMPIQKVGGGAGEPEWTKILKEEPPDPRLSRIFNTLFYAFGIGCCVFLAYGLAQAIRQMLRDFRSGLDENGDQIEELEKKEQIWKRKDQKNVLSQESEAEKIRRRYRKMIRQHRKDRPAPYETPTEIEENAGLQNDEDMQALHKKYEAVRYSETKTKIQSK